jgi:hypothetical protein
MGNYGSAQTLVWECVVSPSGLLALKGLHKWIEAGGAALINAVLQEEDRVQRQQLWD